MPSFWWNPGGSVIEHISSWISRPHGPWPCPIRRARKRFLDHEGKRKVCRFYNVEISKIGFFVHLIVIIYIFRVCQRGADNYIHILGGSKGILDLEFNFTGIIKRQFSKILKKLLTRAGDVRRFFPPFCMSYAQSRAIQGLSHQEVVSDTPGRNAPQGKLFTSWQK